MIETIDVAVVLAEIGRLHLHNMTLEQKLRDAAARIAELEKVKSADSDAKG